MRKVAAATVATGVAALGVFGVTHAIADVTQGYTVKVSGGKGTKKKPKNLTFSTNITSQGTAPTPNGNYATSTTVLSFDKNIKFHPEALPTCSEAQATAGAPVCAKAKVGTGQVGSTAGADGSVKNNPKATYFNGPGKTLVILLTFQPGDVLTGTAVLSGKLKSASGKYGSKLVVNVPPGLQNNLGLTVSLNLFTAKIKGTGKKSGKKVGYIESTGCPKGGKYNFQGVFSYATFSQGGAPAPAVPPSKTITTTAKC